MTTKRFHVRTILTVTTGRLLTKSHEPRNNGIGDLYELLDWMTNDSAYTHQLGRFSAECKPWLLRWFPELAALGTDLALAEFDSAMPSERDQIDAYIDAWVTSFPGIKQEYDVEKITADDHDRKDPIADLVAMRGIDDGIIPVVI